MCSAEVASEVALATWHGGKVVLGSLGLARVRVCDGDNEVTKQKEGNDANKVTQVRRRKTTSTIAGGAANSSGGGGLLDGDNEGGRPSDGMGSAV